VTWLRRNDPKQVKPSHYCKLPYTVESRSKPDGVKGDVWMCDECREVWIIREFPDLYVKGWFPVNPVRAWWLRRRYLEGRDA
jgi:hypothetical protein